MKNNINKKEYENKYNSNNYKSNYNNYKSKKDNIDSINYINDSDLSNNQNILDNISVKESYKIKNKII